MTSKVTDKHHKTGKARRSATPRPGDHAEYDLYLYISGATEHSKAALANIKAVGEKHLKGNYRLTVVDLYQQPGLASKQDIIVAPTLVKKQPLPLRTLIGDLSDEESVLIGLDIVPRRSAEDEAK